MKPSKLCLIGASVSVVISLGCSQSPTGPSKDFRLSALSAAMRISPTDGPSTRAAVVTISGIGFQTGAAVTVDGNRVDATVLDANTLSLEMPPHAAGKVEVAVIRAPGQAPSVVNGGYTFVGPPVIGELFPNTGSTGGGTQLVIEGTGVWLAKTLTLGGVESTFAWEWPNDAIYLSTPAHAAGPVEVIVTDQWGQSGSGTFTYASPDTFDFNGDWNGWVEGQPGQRDVTVVFTIRDNIVVGVSCDNAPSLTLDPAPAVANGEFSFTAGGVGVTGRILSTTQATGSITAAGCGSDLLWSARKK